MDTEKDERSCLIRTLKVGSVMQLGEHQFVVVQMDTKVPRIEFMYDTPAVGSKALLERSGFAANMDDWSEAIEDVDVKVSDGRHPRSLKQLRVLFKAPREINIHQIK